MAIPGSFEAANYDIFEGGIGQGIAYNDISPGNNGDFRPDEYVDAYRDGFIYAEMIDTVDLALQDAKQKLADIKEAGSTVSIANMFDMQMLMNRLSQFSEMSTSMISATNTAIMSMARNIK